MPVPLASATAAPNHGMRPSAARAKAREPRRAGARPGAPVLPKPAEHVCVAIALTVRTKCRSPSVGNSTSGPSRNCFATPASGSVLRRVGVPLRVALHTDAVLKQSSSSSSSPRRCRPRLSTLPHRLPVDAAQPSPMQCHGGSTDHAVLPGWLGVQPLAARLPQACPPFASVSSSASSSSSSKFAEGRPSLPPRHAAAHGPTTLG